MRISPHQGRQMGLALIVCGTVLCVPCVLIAQYRYASSWQATAPSEPTPLPESRPAIARMTVDHFGQVFYADQSRTRARFEGKVIALHGQVHWIAHDNDELWLSGKASPTQAVTVQCRFNARTTSAVSGVKVGQTVTVRGELTNKYGGMMVGDALNFEECSIETLSSKVIPPRTAAIGERK